MKTASAASKALPLACIIAVFAASLSLFLTRDRRYIDNLPGLVDAHRNISAVIVQVLSTLLSMAQMLVICSLINFAARIKLFGPRISIDNLSFWSALSIPRFDIKLPAVRVFLVTLMLVLGPVLGALWSGALTPLSSTTSRNDGHILVPSFNRPINLTMYPAPPDGAIITRCDPQPQDPRGSHYPLLDSCIVLAKLGSLLSTASTATNTTNPRQHPKIDNSTWTYRGRSYGKGSSTGLFDVNETTIKTADQGFSYEETGYKTTAYCSKQPSPIFPFEEYYSPDDGTQVSLWSANTVALESGNVSILPFYVATAIWDHSNSGPFGYFAWTTVSNNGINYLATSSTNWSVGLNDILCTIDFVPMVFLTNVSKSDTFITVTPLRPADNFNQTGDLPEAILSDLDLMSRMSSSSLASGSLDNAIGTNAGAVKLNKPNATADEISSLAMQDSIMAIADDLMAYQGILAVAREDGESFAQPVQRHFAAIKFGQPRFHIAQLIINVVLCVIYLFEAYRTRYWRQMPDFNFVDVKALTLAALGPRDGGTTSPSPYTSHYFPQRDAENDGTKLAAFYDEKSRPRLRYGDHADGSHHLSDLSSARTTSADELSLTPAGFSGMSRSMGSLPGNGHARTNSYTSLNPLLGDP